MVSIDKGQLMSLAATIETIAVGYTSFITTINAKTPFWLTQAPDAQFFASISRIIGPEFASILSGGKFLASNLPARSFNPIGALNQTSIGGAALLIADMFLREHAGSLGYSKVGRFVRAAASGMLMGGILGGIFDPPENGNVIATYNYSPSGDYTKQTYRGLT